MVIAVKGTCCYKFFCLVVRGYLLDVNISFDQKHLYTTISNLAMAGILLTSMMDSGLLLT